MILDGHIHMGEIDVDQKEFLGRLQQAGVDGGIVLSPRPASFSPTAKPYTAEQRLDAVMALAEGQRHLYPFYWIDPTEKDAAEQVERAVKAGVRGFKVICSQFYPGDERALETYKVIAVHHKPMLFHSGILWDGQPSSRYNRPAEFEALLEVPGLRFALAHISWPWCDECIAVYGKLLAARGSRPEPAIEMFIDITPGTPPIYREDALYKLFNVGYDIENNILFGTDNRVEGYSHHRAKEIMELDNDLYVKLKLEQETVSKVYSENLLRFVGEEV